MSTDAPDVRLAAALADRYRIERELGQGGMATVYLAADLKHDRQVAVKVLRPELAAIIGAERFLAEIRTTANLQHPHILPLFDSGEADGFLFYVMPYVEGVSLRDHLTREKQLPIAEAVRTAVQVAAALDYAHRHGVIHRDIKPENIMLHDGTALVADFGIALAASKAGTRMTETGMSLGTPQYMSPEQAMGERELDARSDVYALGCVTYEMLTGEPPFSGPTAQAIVAKVMTAEPVDATSLRKTVPPYLADAVHTALQKLPADRFATAAELAAALEGKAAPTRAAGRATGRSVVPRTPRGVMAAGAGLLGILALMAGWWLRGMRAPRPATGPVEFAFRLGNGGSDRPYLAISPDGRRIVQGVKDSSGANHLVMRELGATALTVIAGTDGATDPSFSPDGNWIAFARDGKLCKVPAAGGPATVLADSVNQGGGWTLDGGALVYTLVNRGLWRVSSAGGGIPTQLTALDTARHEFAHWYPQALPGGRAVIYTSYTTPITRSRIEAVELATGRKTVLLEGALFARYVASGHLLYARDGAMFAVPFDPAALKVTGTAVPVIDDLAWSPQDGVAGFAVSDNGTLAWIRASEWNVDSRVTWVSRSGVEESALPVQGAWVEPRLSPDGRWIAITQTQPKRDIWLFEVGRRLLTQLTHAPTAAFNAIWMPDSRSVVYTLEDPVYDLHRIPIDASAPDAPLYRSPYDKRASAITRDGRTLALVEQIGHGILKLMPLSGGTPAMVDAQSATQRGGAISPDGRWIAYEEINQHDQPQVYVRTLTARGGRIQVSAEGGSQPQWTKGGHEIVYRRGAAMLASAFDPGTGAVGTATLLFRRPDVGQLDGQSVGYDVTPDGSRFLLVVPLERPEVQPTHVVLNWFDELNRKAPR